METWLQKRYKKPNIDAKTDLFFVYHLTTRDRADESCRAGRASIKLILSGGFYETQRIGRMAGQSEARQGNDFDRQRHTERPIPSGAISLPAVWRWGLGWLGLGALCLTAMGKTTGLLALMLLLGIIIYDATHKVFTASPWLMGVCRFWVYVIAGSAGAAGVSGGPIWCGVALALYVAGMGSLAQHESSRGRVPYWPLVLLVAPVVLAMIINSAELRVPALWLSLVLVLWTARCVRTIFQAGAVNVAHMVSGLLAGIVFVDWLALAPWCPQSQWLSVIFLILWGATLLLQRFVPTA